VINEEPRAMLIHECNQTYEVMIGHRWSEGQAFTFSRQKKNKLQLLKSKELQKNWELGTPIGQTILLSTFLIIRITTAIATKFSPLCSPNH
jgi:hypothetical protein